MFCRYLGLFLIQGQPLAGLPSNWMFSYLTGPIPFYAAPCYTSTKAPTVTAQLATAADEQQRHTTWFWDGNQERFMELTHLKGALQKHWGLDGRHRRVKSSASLRLDTKHSSSAQQVPLFWLNVHHLTSSFTLLKELSSLKVKYELEHQQQPHMQHTDTHTRSPCLFTFLFCKQQLMLKRKLWKSGRIKGRRKKRRMIENQ